MGSIFWGMIFILFDFSIETNGVKLGFLPDFVGYLLLLNGLNGQHGIGAENKWFLKAVPYARGMAVYTGILYLFDLFGLSYRLGGVSIVMWMAAVAVSFLVFYCIIQGIKGMEKQYGIQLNGDNLANVWKLDLLCQAIYLITYLLMPPVLSVVVMLATIVVNILFAAAFYQAKRQYEAFL